MLRFLLAALTIFLITHFIAIPTSARRVATIRNPYGTLRLAVNGGPIQTGTPAQPTDLSAQFLKAHNDVRAHFKQPPLKWDQGLAAQAQSWAQTHQQQCSLEIPADEKYGENSFWSLESKDWTAADVVGTWADEFREYNQYSKVCFSESVCGYSTQLLWKNTQRLGCGFVECGGAKKGGLFVCFYDPKSEN